MSSMTMLVQKVRWTDDGSRYVEARAILDTKEDMARQLIELLDNSMEDSYTWNDMGDEYRVDSSYAEACQWYEFTLDTYKKLCKMYSDVPIPRWWATTFTSKDKDHTYMERKDLSINIDDYDAECEVIEITGSLSHVVKRMSPDGETVCAFEFLQAVHNKGYFKSYYGDVKEYLTTKLPSYTNAVSFYYDHFGSTDVQLIRMPSNFFNIPSRIGEVNETLRDYATRKDDEEYARHVAHENTEEGKAEREEEAERERDLATFMGESGYTSFARNDDGTTTVWR